MQVIHQLDAASQHDEELASLVSRLRSAQIEIQDCSSTLEDLSSSYQFSQEEYEKVSEALDTSHRLLKKYQCEQIADLEALVSSHEERYKIRST